MIKLFKAKLLDQKTEVDIYVDEKAVVGLLALLKGKVPSPSPTEEIEAEDPVPLCPVCESRMIQRKSSFGPFWGCTRYPKCKGTVPIEEEEF